MIDYATPWSFLLLWKVIWEQQKLNLALGEINSQYFTKKFKMIHFEKIPSCIFPPFVHLLMFFNTILKVFRARSQPFFGIFFQHFLGSFQQHQERPMRDSVGYVDFKPRNAGLLSTSAGYNILNFKECLVNELINIRFFYVLKR